MPEGIIIVGDGVINSKHRLEMSGTEPTSMVVSSGGTAYETSVGKNCLMVVSSGGTAHQLAENGGNVIIEDGADVTFVPNTFSDIVLNEDENTTVHSGTTALNVTINYHGRLAIFSGGVASDIIANSGGSFGVFSGGTALQIVENGGYAWLEDGATVTFLPNSFSGLELEESATVHSGTTATDTTVNAGGILWGFSGGLLNGVTVNPGGMFNIYSGGTALQVVENGGYVWAESGTAIIFIPNAFSDLTLTDGQVTLHSGTTATDTTVNSGGKIWALSGGLLSGTVINDSGRINISSGGLANDVIINSGGRINVSSGGTTTDITVNSGGLVNLINGGFASGITANDGAKLWLAVAPNTYAQGSYDGAEFEIKDATFSEFDVRSDNIIFIYDGGTAHDITASDKGIIRVSGGLAEGVAINSAGTLEVHGGEANDITANAGGTLRIYSGGVANNVAVKTNGYLLVNAGGTATNVEWTPCEGYVDAPNGAVVTYASSYSGVYYGSRGELFSHEDVMTDMTLGAHYEMYVMNGGAANGTVVDYDGELYVFSGGVADDTTVKADGWGEVSSGAVASNTDVQADGIFLVHNGGIVTGNLTLAEGAYVKFYNGAVLNFDLTQTTPEADALVNGLSFLTGTPTYTLTVAGTEAEGTYCLADGAEDFDATLTVVNTSGSALGTIALGCENTINGVKYTLSLAEDDLTVTIAIGSDDDVDFTGNLTSATVEITSDMLASSVDINQSGRLKVREGGTAIDTIVHFGGSMYVSRGGTANDIIVNSNGTVETSNGLINGAIVNAGGNLLIYNGAKITGQMTFEDGAMVIPFVGSILDFDLTQTTADADALVNDLSVLMGTPAYTLTVDGTEIFGTYYLAGGAEKFNKTITVVNPLGEELGTIALGSENTINDVKYTLELAETDLTVTIAYASDDDVDFTGDLTSATVEITSGMLASSVDINQSGRLKVSEGGIAVDTIVHLGGDLYVYSGGTALQVKEDGGYVYGFEDTKLTFVPNSFSGLVLNDSDWVTVHSGTTATDTTINHSGHLLIYSGGIANGATLNPYGTIYVSSGGTATDITASEGAYLGLVVTPDTYVQGTYGGSAFEVKDAVLADYTIHPYCWATALDGGVINHATIEGSGAIDVYDGGVASDVTVDSGGSMNIYGGGAAYEIKENGGAVYLIDFDGQVTATFVSNTFSGTVLNFMDRATVHSGTTATDVTVNSIGSLRVYDGGVASDVFVNSEGYVGVLSGGMVDAIDVNHGGKLSVDSGGTAHQVKENGGYVRVFDGADVTFVANTIDRLALDNNNSATVHSGTTATDVTLGDESLLEVYAGGVASSVVVNEDGRLFVSSGGTANNVIVNLDGTAETSQGLINGATVNAGGNLLIYDGAKITGQMTFESGAMVIPFVGSILDFDLTQTATDADALVNNLSVLLGTPTYTLTVDGTEALGTYCLAGGADKFNKPIIVVNTLGEELGALTFEAPLVIGDLGVMLNKRDAVLSVLVGDPNVLPENLVGNSSEVTWDSTGSEQYIVEYSTDNFEHVLADVVTTNSLDTFTLPAGTYQWRVRANDGVLWANGQEITVEETESAPQVVSSDEDGAADLFFARKYDTWNAQYQATHVGLLNGWEGTGDSVPLDGKNQITDVFQGSTDPSLLCLTDDDNGDALFVDDIYSELPGTLTAQQARIAQIKEIRAGGGDDIVDLTSQRFEYVGDGLTVRGGLGNDVIWANTGDNWLFGDEGNDRIVGASGNDVLAGGAGNDTLHGGGGDDIFAFGGKWSNDTVQQLAGGSSLLWFDGVNRADLSLSADENGDAVLASTVGQVTLIGVKHDEIAEAFAAGENVLLDGLSLRFGDDGSNSDLYSDLLAAGAFSKATSQHIFEERNKGLLA